MRQSFVAYAIALSILLGIIGGLMASSPDRARERAEAEANAQRPLGIVPAPALGHGFARGYFSLTTNTLIVADGDEGFQSAARLLAQHLSKAAKRDYRVETTTATTAAADLKNGIVITATDADSQLGEEGYELKVTSDSVVIHAPKAAGAFYATQSLRQLMSEHAEDPDEKKEQTWIQRAEMRDYPRFAYRGLLLDSSRHIQSVEFIKRTLDLMAFHKLNRLQWHLTDENGWRVEIRKYPKLTEVGAWRDEDGKRYGGFFSQEQIRDIVKYAAERHITIIPEIEMPAHCYSALASYPELACVQSPALKVKRIGQTGPDIFCAGNPNTIEFLHDVLTEVIDLFPSPVIHIGADECSKERWTSCTKCQSLMQREGLKSGEELQHWFVCEMAKFIESKGRRMQAWNEAMQGGKLPKSVIVQQWNDPESGAASARSGNDVVVSDTSWTYFDYDYDTIPLKKVYEAEPIPPKLEQQYWPHILGAQAQMWTERPVTEWDHDKMIWPRLIALAEVTWSCRERRVWKSFLERMPRHIYRLSLRGLGATDLGTADPATTWSSTIEHLQEKTGITLFISRGIVQ